MCVLWYGARHVIDGKLTAGQLSAFVVYAVFVSANVGALAGVFSSLIRVCTHDRCLMCVTWRPAHMRVPPSNTGGSPGTG